MINADSMQVYKRLRILTARPTPAEEARAPHRLYGWLEPDDPCSAGRWSEAARREIAAARADGKLPILTGGTGFYLEALAQGLPPAPEVPPNVREAARAEVAADPDAAHRRLAAFDPATAERFPPRDLQRLSRALEVWAATGERPSVVLAPAPPPDIPPLRVVLTAPPRALLYARIDARAAAMAAAGAAAEAAAFQALGVDPRMPAAKAIGVREFAEAHVNETLLPNAISVVAQASRRYAKRQITWFRHRVKPDIAIEMELNSNFIDELVSELPDYLLTKH